MTSEEKPVCTKTRYKAERFALMDAQRIKKKKDGRKMKEPKIYREEPYREFKIVTVEVQHHSSFQGLTDYLNYYILYSNGRIYYHDNTYFIREDYKEYLKEAKKIIDGFFSQKFFEGDKVCTEHGGVGAVEEAYPDHYSVDWVTIPKSGCTKNAWWTDNEGLQLIKSTKGKGKFFELSEVR